MPTRSIAGLSARFVMQRYKNSQISWAIIRDIDMCKSGGFHYCNTLRLSQVVRVVHTTPV